LPIFEQAVDEIGVFIKKIVSPNPAVRKILTGKPGFTGKISVL
jgi:hypothetical protein